VAPQAGARPVVDGNLSEWAGLSPTLLNKDTASHITGVVPTYADLSAELRTAWAPDALYFAANIADDVLVGNNSTQIWGDDVLELSILAPGDSQPRLFTLCVDGRTTLNGIAIASLTYVTRTVPGGWALEVAIPPTALGLGALPVNGQYPFNFALWDDDLRTYPGQTHMFWQSDTVNVYKADWGTLKLDSTVYNFPQAGTATPTPTATATATSTATLTPTATATPTQTPSPTATPTPTDTPAPGEIRGVVWLDTNGDGIQDAGEPGLAGVTVRLLRDSIQIGQAATASDGTYRYSALAAGNYVVQESQPAWVRFSTTPDEVPVTLAAGETRTVNFGDWDGRALYLPLVLQ
jgi:hypothetical protein